MTTSSGRVGSRPLHAADHPGDGGDVGASAVNITNEAPLMCSALQRALDAGSLTRRTRSRWPPAGSAETEMSHEADITRGCQPRANSRSTAPGRAPVCAPCSVTTDPLTIVAA